MGNYYCDYISDDSNIYRRVTIDVFIVDVTIGTRGQRVGTTPQTDEFYIPPIWFEHCFLKEPKKGYCSLDYIPRNALLWLGTGSYLYVPLPWQGNSPQFNEFFRYAGEEYRDKFVSVGLNGEFIGAEWLEYLVK